MSYRKEQVNAAASHRMKNEDDWRYTGVGWELVQKIQVEGTRKKSNPEWRVNPDQTAETKMLESAVGS